MLHVSFPSYNTGTGTCRLVLVLADVCFHFLPHERFVKHLKMVET